MTLGEIVKQYRTEHELSLRDFSKICGISNAYISMIEKNEHPKTKKPIAPSLDKVRQISSAIGMDFNTLLNLLDGDVEVSLCKSSKPTSSKSELSNDEEMLLSLYKKLSKDGKQKLIERANELYDLGYVQKRDAEKMA